MAKDPAVLIYFDKWIASTNGLKAEFRAWYFDLLMYNYDKGSIPNDLDEIAGICRVRPSEYQVFNQMVEQVLKQKFKQDSNGAWYNELTGEILRKREAFVDKRAKSGNIGVVIKVAKAMKGFTAAHLEKLKKHLYTLSPEDIEKHKNKQMLEHLLKLYINVDVNEDINIDKEGGAGGNEMPLPDFLIVWEFEQIWKQHKPNYPSNQQLDYKPLREIAEFIISQEKLKTDQQDRGYYQPVLDIWNAIAEFISKHSLFAKYSLFQVSRHIQSIVQEFSSGSGNKPPAGTNGKTSLLEKNFIASQNAINRFNQRIKEQQQQHD